MPITPITPPILTAPPLSPDRADRTTFVARSIALDDWRKTLNVPEMTAALANVYSNAVVAYDSVVAAYNSAATAIAKAAEALASANAASGSATNSAASTAAALGHKNTAAVSAGEAATSALAAQGFASQAQAVSPDSPIRINTSKVTTDFTLATGYNGSSAGPIEIADNITVTISQFATWSIV